MPRDRSKTGNSAKGATPSVLTPYMECWARGAPGALTFVAFAPSTNSSSYTVARCCG